MKGELGDDEWLRNEIKRTSEPDTRKRDFLNQWTAPHEGLVFTPEIQQQIRDQSEDKSALNSLVTGFLNSVKDQSHLNESGPFKWTCISRHPEVMMFSNQKRCRYCKPTEIHEDDHPLFWRGNRPIYNDDLSWK